MVIRTNWRWSFNGSKMKKKMKEMKRVQRVKPVQRVKAKTIPKVKALVFLKLRAKAVVYNFTDNKDYQNFMAQLAYSCANVGVLLINRKDTDKIYLSNIDIGLLTFHLNLIRGCVERQIISRGNETNTFNAYIEKLNECLLRREINNIKCEELMDQLKEVLEI